VRLYPNWQRECVESVFSGRSSRPRRTNFSLQLRYASGEAARLSIGREGFDLPTERQFLKTTGCSSVRPELLPWKQEAVGSNPTALTILRLRKVARSGAQPVSKAGPTSGSRVRLLHLPPRQTAVIRHCCARVGWHWRAQGVVNAPHLLWWFNSIPTHQLQDGYKTARRAGGRRSTLILNPRGRGLTAESLGATQGVWVRLPPSAPIQAQSRTCDRIPDQMPLRLSVAAPMRPVRLDRHRLLVPTLGVPIRQLSPSRER
jgi:hypothetical protein